MDESSHQQKGKVEIGGFLVELFTKPGEKPWVTYAIIAVCAATCAYLNLSRKSAKRVSLKPDVR
jgi:hypothetical protein